jgi:hypothetical protein
MAQTASASQYDTIIETLGVPITEELLENIQKHIHLMKITEDEKLEKEKEKEKLEQDQEKEETNNVKEKEKKTHFEKPLKGAKVPGFRKQVEYGEKKRIKP